MCSTLCKGYLYVQHALQQQRVSIQLSPILIVSYETILRDGGMTSKQKK
jgi:hypothetical protein